MVSVLVTPTVSCATAIGIEFQIHPELTASRCVQLPASASLATEDDFPKLLARGWVALRESSFDESRRPACLQEVTVIFPSLRELHDFVSAMSPCPQYPFYSGADYQLQTAIFEYAARSADGTTYGRLLSKDGRCASEMNPPLYAILRKNPRAFLRAFASLDHPRQRITTATQYDFNSSVEEQQFDVKGLSPVLAAVARRFNELLAAVAKSR